MPSSWWKPEKFIRKREKLLARAKIMAATRNYFAAEGFIEVDTPHLAAVPGPEPHLTPFATEYISPRGEKQPLYLAASPELACKKLLVAGMERIYQLSHVFRNAEGSSRHHPEFTLLEWYRVGAGYGALMEDCERLLLATAQTTGKNSCNYSGIDCDLTKKPERISVAEAFKQHAGVDLPGAGKSVEKIANEAQRIGVRTGKGDRFDDIMLRILAERIEPHLGEGAPCFLTDYPISMAALAAPHPRDPHLAQRFELYVSGLELANGFVELTDVQEQRHRFVEDRKLKKEIYGDDYPLNEDFLKALEQGLPDCAGIALGFDRLVMLATGAEHIEEVLWAPTIVNGEQGTVKNLFNKFF